MQQVRIVLCRPSHPGNIGAAARAMKTMGLADLRLVAPEKYPAAEAQWMATHAADVLANATVHEDLAGAIADCVAAFALSARPREWSTQVLDARRAAAHARKQDGKVAFVFGSESAGLTNEEMLACQYLVHIPADPRMTSLNLAQAVQVVAYELFMATDPAVAGEKRRFLNLNAVRPASHWIWFRISSPCLWGRRSLRSSLNPPREGSQIATHERQSS